MTYHDNGKEGLPLPRLIELKDPKAGELRRMVKRTEPVAIRFNKVKQRNEPERYMAKELMLYCPMQEELEPDQVKDLYLEEHEGQLKVAIVKAQVMPHIECVEEARHYVAETVKELDMDLKKFGSAYIADGPGINGSNGEPKNDQVGVFISFSRKGDSTTANVRPSVCPSVINQNPPTAWNHYRSSFFIIH